MRNISILACASVIFGITATGSAVIVKKTFTGVTTFNNVAEGAITREFPVGTPWEVQVEWETTSAPLFISETQGQYRLKKFSLSFQGATRKWTTSSGTDKASFTLNYLFGGSEDEIQFTSGWGPAGHTNPTIENWQPYSINIVLADPTGKAIPALSPAPSAIDLSKWSSSTGDSYFKMYLNNDGNRFISGNLKLPVVNEPEISVRQPAKSELVSGSDNRDFGSVLVRAGSASKTFTIKNTGKAPLAKLSVSKAGKHGGDFFVSRLSTPSLEQGDDTQFIVRFDPKVKGRREAVIRIANNDKDENPFTFKVTGFGK